MKPENIAFLEQHKFHYETLTKAGYVSNLDYHVKEGWLRIIQEEFNPGYMATLWCPPCIAEMINIVYAQYHKYLESGNN